MVGTIVYQLTKNLSIEEIKAAGLDQYFVDHTAGIYPASASGVPYSAAAMQVKGDIIADAKYKRLIRPAEDVIDENLSRDDLHQMVTYLHITSSRTGIFVNPVNFRVMNPYNGEYFPEDVYCMKIGELYGDGGYIYILELNIPRECASFEDFSRMMNNNEGVLYDKLHKLIDPTFLSHRPDYL